MSERLKTAQVKMVNSAENLPRQISPGSARFEVGGTTLVRFSLESRGRRTPLSAPEGNSLVTLDHREMRAGTGKPCGDSQGCVKTETGC